MTAITPVERVSEILEGANYHRLKRPLKIAGLAFDLPAAFIGSERSPDLVLVIDAAIEPAAHILRKVEGIGRALDVMRSKRSVTIVLTGPRPEAEMIEALAKVGRVLPIGTKVDDDPSRALTNWLAILLPLTLPTPSQDIADPLASIRSRAEDFDEQIREFIEMAPYGADVVQAGLHDLLTRTLDQDE
jgi:hypothetical protein